MDFRVCARCGVEIENKGIHFRKHVFCSDECCEAYEADFADKDEPVIDELVDDDDMDPEDLEDDLDFTDEDGDDPLDDDYDLKPEDF